MSYAVVEEDLSFGGIVLCQMCWPRFADTTVLRQNTYRCVHISGEQTPRSLSNVPVRAPRPPLVSSSVERAGADGRRSTQVGERKGRGGNKSPREGEIEGGGNSPGKRKRTSKGFLSLSPLQSSLSLPPPFCVKVRAKWPRLIPPFVSSPFPREIIGSEKRCN